MELIKNDHQNIVGWGSDADKKNRPAFRMWKPANTGAHWAVPDQQPNFKDFYSIERPGPTHVFGTSVPPSGLSGLLRKKAFTYSESKWGHWLILLLADRINVVEGLIDDLMKGTKPGLLKERGWKIDKEFKTLRYKKIMVLGAASLVIPLIYLFSKRGDQNKR